MAAFSFTVNGTTDGAFPPSVAEGPAPVVPSETPCAGDPALGLPSGPTSVLAVKTVYCILPLGQAADGPAQLAPSAKPWPPAAGGLNRPAGTRNAGIIVRGA